MAAPRKEKEGFEPLRATVEQMGMGIAQVSLDGKWLMISHRLCEILGYCENELLQTSFEIFFRLPHFLANPRGHKCVPAEDIAGSMIEDRVTRQDGATIWLRTAFSTIRDESTGQPRALLLLVEETTFQKNVEQDRRELAERVMRAQETERSRIARELHDDIGQSLAIVPTENSISLKKNEVKELWGANHSVC